MRHLALVLGMAMLGGISVTPCAKADSITQGFEGGGFTLFADGGNTAAIANSPVHGGSQSVQLAVTSGSGDAEVDMDVASTGLTLGQITSANYWVDRTTASSNQAPYIYFVVQTPGGNAYVVMFNPHDIGINPPQGTFSNIQVGLNTTFHVAGVATGITNPGGLTLADVDASQYAPGEDWSSFAVKDIDIEVGQGGNDGIPYQYYVDDLTVNYTAVPEPSSLAALSVAILGLGLLGYRRRSTSARSDIL